MKQKEKKEIAGLKPEDFWGFDQPIKGIWNYDWRDYVPDIFRNEWDEMTTREKLIVAFFCRQSDRDNYDAEND